MLILPFMTFFNPGESVNARGSEPDFSFIKTTHVYKKVRDHKIHADVYKLPGDEIRPAIIWIHGGALIFGTRSSIPQEQLKNYLQSEYTLVSIDYRLAPETKLPGIIEDLEDAYSWIVEEGPELFGIDPERIAIIGHSAGGYLTLTAGFLAKPAPAALVSFYGYGDITGPWYSEPDPFYSSRPEINMEQAFKDVGDSVLSGARARTDEYNRGNFYLYCRQNGLWPEQVAGKDPFKNRKWFRQYEAIFNISDSYPPTVLLHGEQDTDVPFQQSEAMAAELEKNGRPFLFIRDPGWGHGFDRAGLDDPLVGAAFKSILDFLEEYLK